MKRIILAMLLMMTLMLAVSAYEMDDTIIDGLNVTTSVEAVLNQHPDKNVMLVFDSKSCAYCDMLKENVLGNPDVQKELNDKYIVVLVDVNKHADIALKYKIYGTPSTVILNKTGDEIYRIYGYVESDEFLDAIKEI